jgi:transposase
LRQLELAHFAGNGGLQVAKKRVRRHTKEFRRMAVERLKSCDNIVALSQELGVHRRLLYQWRDRLDALDSEEESPPGNTREGALRQEISQLQRVLAEKTLEVDFFKGALQKVEARRRNSGMTGEKASTTKSKK